MEKDTDKRILSGDPCRNPSRGGGLTGISRKRKLFKPEENLKEEKEKKTRKITKKKKKIKREEESKGKNEGTDGRAAIFPAGQQLLGKPKEAQFF